MNDPPAPDASSDFDDKTELVSGASWGESGTRPTPRDNDLPPGGWEDEEATAVVSATDIGGFFGDRFRVDARLGVGAMGRVLTAVDMKTGTLVALKVLHKDRAKDAAVVERFQREAAVLREMRHPAIVRLIAFDRAKDGTWWLAMEHLVGRTLKDRLSRGGPFTPREAWPVLAALCDGLAVAHAQGILHRDLKPENVLLLESGLPPCKVLDFGLSRYTAKPDRITATGTVLGTPRYMAPEMLTDEADIDHRADVFAVGAIAFEMLTGRSIYPAEDFGQLFGCIIEGRTLPLRTVRPDASPELERVIADAVARQRDSRTPSIDEFCRRLARALGVSEDRSFVLPAEAHRPVAHLRVARVHELPPIDASLEEPPTSRTSGPLAAWPASTALGAQPSQALGQPSFDQPSLGQPSFGQPSFGQPSFGQPSLGQPSLGQPSLGQPSLDQPSHGQAQFGPSPMLGRASTPSLGVTRPSHTGVAPPAAFTPPETRTPSPRRVPWLWIGLFVIAAVTTMVSAGVLAYALRIYLAR